MSYNGKGMIIKREAIKPIEFDKLKIIDYTAGQENSSSFAEITVPVGVSHKLSWSNRSDKYYYVVKGKVNFTVNEESNNLSSGDVCIVPKGKRFSYTNTDSSEAILILVHTPNFKLECEVFEE
jgi:mannose-6-phosphate isomerase-like protein (cupin superfamily)